MARPDAVDDLLVTVIGSGFSGILAGIQLERLGIPFRIIERQAGIGGTWELNDYPEARVDITTFLYQYKFVKNYPLEKLLRHSRRAEGLRRNGG